jgi:hypothetical protein
VEYDPRKRTVADTGEQGKYAEEHFIKPPPFLEPWLLILIFNSFNIEKKFIMKNYYNFNREEFTKPVWLAPPKNWSPWN